MSVLSRLAAVNLSPVKLMLSPLQGRLYVDGRTCVVRRYPLLGMEGGCGNEQPSY